MPLFPSSSLIRDSSSLPPVGHRRGNKSTLIAFAEKRERKLTANASLWHSVPSRTVCFQKVRDPFSENIKNFSFFEDTLNKPRVSQSTARQNKEGGSPFSLYFCPPCHSASSLFSVSPQDFLRQTSKRKRGGGGNFIFVPLSFFMVLLCLCPISRAPLPRPSAFAFACCRWRRGTAGRKEGRKTERT